MSRFILLAGVAGLYASGCSSPAEDGDVQPAPMFPPPGFANGGGQGGTGQQVGQAGTGGSSALPTAGTGGTAAAQGGTGGTSAAAAGAGGTAGSAGAGGTSSTIPTGTGNLIMHDSTGWVAGSTNGVQIQGSFYPFSDEDAGGDTTVTLGAFTASPTSACASGTASQVLMAEFGTYWGGGVGLNLADPGGGLALGDWSPGTVTGFSFTVSGTGIPTALRFNAIGADGTTQYCGNLAAGANTVTLTTLRQACYDMAPGAALATGTQLQAIQWQVVTNPDGTTPFNFCIENLTAIGG